MANYLVTLAVGIAAARAGMSGGAAVEVISTLIIAPFVFTFGELIPKNLYYRAPLQLLRKNARWFFLFHRLFTPISFPLMAVAGPATVQPGEFRSRNRDSRPRG